ncbi:hypothetical protein SDC9_101105 [bioreactor metagenome]|uniref:Uncharacterized protein n=1 Tax=bioreactor metagenome TaxID=1076179 RepID=A0A645AMQ7_9ZZZZ
MGALVLHFPFQRLFVVVMAAAALILIFLVKEGGFYFLKILIDVADILSQLIVIMAQFLAVLAEITQHFQHLQHQLLLGHIRAQLHALS